MIFRVATAWITLGLIIFVLWISGGTIVGRLIAGGVLIFGLLQWWVLRRLSHQMAAKSAEEVETSDQSD